MSKNLLLAVVLLGVVAACAPKTEPAAPVSEEPVYTGKYK